MEGSLNTVVIVAATIFAICIIHPESISLDNNRLMLAVFRNAMIGFMIRYLAPTWYRSAILKQDVTIEDSSSFIEGEQAELATNNAPGNP